MATNFTVTTGYKVETPMAMPPQHLSSTFKGTDWGRRCVKAIQGFSSGIDDMGRTTRENKEENYDLVNSRFREENFDYVLNPF